MSDAVTAALTEKEIVDRAVDEAFIAEGYVDKDGEPDKTALSRAVFDLVKLTEVTKKGERKSKAISRYVLLERAFPHLPDPDSWDQLDDPALAEEVRDAIDKQVWAEASPRFNGHVQQMVGQNGNGMVLCRTKQYGNGSAELVYITADRACILADQFDGLSEQVKRQLTSAGKQAAMCAERQPENATRYDSAFKKLTTHAIGAGRGQLTMALEAAKNGAEPDVEDE